MPFLFQLTTELDAGTFSRATKPLIKEFIPTSRAGDDPTAEDRQKLARLLRLKRVVIVQLGSRTAGETGATRQVESENAQDEYSIYIKTGSFSDTNNVYGDVRDNLVEKTDSTVYQRYELDPTSYLPQPGRFDATLKITAHRGGMQRV